MNPLLSFATSAALGAAGLACGWLASKNIIPAADVDADTAKAGAALLAGGMALFTWWKSYSSRAQAKVDYVNSGALPEVKVVPVATPAAAVTIDAKGAAVAIPGAPVVGAAP
jgi:hypothetical protein